MFQRLIGLKNKLSKSKKESSPIPEESNLLEESSVKETSLSPEESEETAVDEEQLQFQKLQEEFKLNMSQNKARLITDFQNEIAKAYGFKLQLKANYYTPLRQEIVRNLCIVEGTLPENYSDRMLQKFKEFNATIPIERKKILTDVIKTIAIQCTFYPALNSFKEKAGQLEASLNSDKLDKIDMSKLDELDLGLTPIITAKEKRLSFRLPDSESAPSTSYGITSSAMFVHRKETMALVDASPLKSSSQVSCGLRLSNSE